MNVTESADGSGMPVTVVASGGIPVDVVAGSATVTVSADGRGAPVTVVSGSLGVVPAPSWSVQPSISGTANVGRTLTGNDGTISNGTVSSRQWLRDGVAIGGATASTYVLVDADNGTTTTYRPTATGAGGSASATSAGVGTTYQTAVAAWFAAMSVQPDVTRKGLLNTMVLGLMDDGDWNSIDMLQVYAAHDAQAARVDAKLPSRVATLVSAPTFTADRGYLCDGVASYIDTGWAMSAGPSASLNSSFLGAYINSGTDTGDSAVASIGSLNGANGSFIFPRGATNSIRHRVNQATTIELGAAAVLTRMGLSVVERTASGAIAAYRNGASVGTGTQVSTAVPTSTVFVGGYNNGGVFTGGAGNRFAYAVGGASLGVAGNLRVHNRILTFLTAIGGQ